MLSRCYGNPVLGEHDSTRWQLYQTAVDKIVRIDDFIDSIEQVVGMTLSRVLLLLEDV